MTSLTRFPFFQGPSARRGTTLVEMMFSAAILVVVLTGIMGLFLFMLVEERSNVTRLNMTQEVSTLHRQLRNLAANGANIVVVAGEIDNDVVRFRRMDTTKEVAGEEVPVVSELRYVDEDEDNDTIGDNRLVLVPDVDEEDATIDLVNFASRIPDPADEDEFLPVFTRSPGFGSPLVVQFRVGDRSGERLGRVQRAQSDVDRRDDANTGPGYQGIVFQAAYGPRNG
jgi:hypothetical protein